MTAEHPLHDLAMTIRYDLTAAQGKLTELIRQIAELEPPTVTQCTINGCGYRPGINMPTIAEHIERTHPELRGSGLVAVARAHTPAPEEA